MRRRTVMPDSIILPPRWPRYLRIALVSAVVLAALLYERTARPPVELDDYARYHDRSFRVVRVVDGDTLDIDAPDGDKPTTRIRLWGVDTPEVARGKRPGAFFGSEASAFAKQTLTDRMVHVVLSPNDTRGKFGRLLAYVFLERGGPMFNEMLLEQGYAYADRRFDHHYKSEFEDLEKLARKENAGLWADVTTEAMPKWRQRFERRGD